jgi:hypothetical protein
MRQKLICLECGRRISAVNVRRSMEMTFVLTAVSPLQVR